MTNFALACSAMLAFLLPLNAYFLFLASVNRRGKPLMISGAWDAVGLLFAGSGFFLVTVPMLFSQYYRHIDPSAGDGIGGDWLHGWTLWIVYFLTLIGAGALMVLQRSHRTIVYNVDGEQFDRILEQALAALHLTATRKNRRLVLTAAVATASPESTAIMAASPVGTGAADDHRNTELRVDPFPLLCHVTLHWDSYAAEVRQAVERELEKGLPFAAPLENRSAGWFFSIGGFLFGAVMVFLFTVAFLMVFGVR